MAKKKTDELRIPVTFGNVSIGVETARVSMRIDRSTLTLNQADSLLTERRLQCSIETARRDDDKDQTNFTESKITGAADTKGFSVKKKHVSSGLTFVLAEIPVEDLSHFSTRFGYLTVIDNTTIPDDAPADEE